ncbi:MAG: glycosyltransferase family 2 protein [Undibacterium sp.]|uniref:glycosyltransferase family 2 protein n=1 Tax=Undibacterium sp. TaxID=1914977 RepID=UPI0027245C82|nr:glycosyltransferase family 2 protein [Undibacterium sp.]MDO8652454.1 glycosyltransferase family 2 protein [Undibacterium sp.]
MHSPVPLARFCVVTPNFNMAGYLAETIESVLANLGPDDQYFVVDGGSTDGSIEVLKQYEGRISGWVSEPDRGYSDAVAKGFEMGPSQFQCWIACGDLLLPGALDLARSVFESTNADMIYGDDVYIDEQGMVLQITSGQIHNLAGMMLWGGWTPLQDACFWKTDLYTQIGGINPNVRYAADYDLFLRISLNGMCCYTPHVFSAFRRHDGQTSEKFRAAYKREKSAASKRAVESMPKGAVSRWSRIYCWLFPKFRARMRFINVKRVKPARLGQPVHECRAALSSNF